MRIILLLLVLMVFNCKSSKKISDNTDLGLFVIEKQIDEDLILLSKKSSTLKNHGEIEKESAYSLKVPITLKKVNSSVSMIPNENEFIFDNSQKVLIFGNKEGVDTYKINLSKESFLSELDKDYLSDSISSLELKKGRFFGICSNDRYILVYLNVKERNVPMFNDILKSQVFL